MRSIFQKKINLRPLTIVFTDCILVAHPLDSVVCFWLPRTSVIHDTSFHKNTQHVGRSDFLGIKDPLTTRYGSSVFYITELVHKIFSLVRKRERGGYIPEIHPKLMLLAHIPVITSSANLPSTFGSLWRHHSPPLSSSPSWIPGPWSRKTRDRTGLVIASLRFTSSGELRPRGFVH